MILTVGAAVETHDNSDVRKVTCVVPKAVTLEARIVLGCLPKLIKISLPGGLFRCIGERLAPAATRAIIKRARLVLED